MKCDSELAMTRNCFRLFLRTMWQAMVLCCISSGWSNSLVSMASRFYLKRKSQSPNLPRKSQQNNPPRSHRKSNRKNLMFLRASQKSIYLQMRSLKRELTIMRCLKVCKIWSSRISSTSKKVINSQTTSPPPHRSNCSTKSTSLSQKN